MDLGYLENLALGTKGGPLLAEYLRDLTEEDLADTTPLGVKTAPLKKLRQTHHTLARLIASGMKQVEVSAQTGYSLSRISILLNDPAFKELVAGYQQDYDREFVDAQRRLADVALSALDEIQERLETNPDSIPTKDLMGIVELGMDRSVAPKKGLGQSPVGAGGFAPTINISFVAPKGPTIEGHSRPLTQLEDQT